MRRVPSGFRGIPARNIKREEFGIYGITDVAIGRTARGFEAGQHSAPLSAAAIRANAGPWIREKHSFALPAPQEHSEEGPDML